MATTAPLVVGVDRSDESAAALTLALRWATALGRPLTVVHGVINAAMSQPPRPLICFKTFCPRYE